VVAEASVVANSRALAAAANVGRELVLVGFTSLSALLLLQIFLVCVRRFSLALEVVRVVLL
jgi:hypothetical protein